MTRWTITCLALAVALTGCGDSTTGPQDERRVATFSGSLDDPARCTCDAGIRSYTIQPSASGRLDAVATVQPADAHLVVRLLDNTLNNVYAVSAQQGARASLGYDVAPGTYSMQVFLASDGPRQATFTLNVTYP